MPRKRASGFENSGTLSGVADSGMTYRRRYMGSLRAEAVLDLLVYDETNPRSLASQLAALEDDVNHLPRPARGAGRSPEQRHTLAALNAVWLAEAEKLALVQDASRPALGELLDTLTRTLPLLSDAITQQYLSHLQTSRHLMGPEGAKAHEFVTSSAATTVL